MAKEINTSVSGAANGKINNVNHAQYTNYYLFVPPLLDQRVGKYASASKINFLFDLVA